MSISVSNSTKKFISLIKRRTGEDTRAFGILFSNQLYGNCFSVLRQELDSMIRVIYLLHLPDLSSRETLIESTLKGEKWKKTTPNGKAAAITDKEMSELADTLNGWTLSVYKFGCAFIHLSDFHDYQTKNPFASLSADEKESIINHMANYHGAQLNPNSTMEEIVPFLDRVFDKIVGNLECYVKDLESGTILDAPE